MKTADTGTMHIIRVFPLSRGMPKETLSYFSQHPYNAGVVIEVPVRNKQVPALVVNSASAAENKARLKSADYSLKKLERQNGRTLFTSAFIQTVRRIAEYSAASPGAVFYELVPQTILENAEEIEMPNLSDKDTTNLQAPPMRIIQAPADERYTEYENIVRNSFAKNESAYIAAPSQHDIEKVANHFSSGVSEHTYRFYGSLTDKKIIERWNAAVTSDHPVVIIATPHFFSLPRPDLKTIIIEREGAESFKQRFRPFLDMRTAARQFADTLKADRVVGDIVLRIETLWQYRKKDAEAAYPPKFRHQYDIEKLLVDMKKHENAQEEDFTIFSTPLQEKLEAAADNKSHIFLFTNRKGLYPFTICGDCGETVTCKRCSYPLVVKEDDEKRTFVCNGCGHTEDAHRMCDNCGSWKLWPLGVGIDRVAEALAEQFPDLPVCQIDSDTTSTKKEVREAVDDFYNSNHGVLLATKMGVPFVDDVDIVSVISVDSLLSLPDINVHESVFRLLIELQSETGESFILQTRRSDMRLLETALSGNTTAFYRDEIADRKQFNYPPFSTIIKITVRDRPKKAKERMRELHHKLSDYSPQIYPAFIPQKNNKKIMHALLSLPRGDWPDKTLVRLLQSLDPACEVNIEPQSLL